MIPGEFYANDDHAHFIRTQIEYKFWSVYFLQLATNYPREPIVALIAKMAESGCCDYNRNKGASQKVKFTIRKPKYCPSSTYWYVGARFLNLENQTYSNSNIEIECNSSKSETFYFNLQMNPL